MGTKGGLFLILAFVLGATDAEIKVAVAESPELSKLPFSFFFFSRG